jgi:hypothetical protein
MDDTYEAGNWTRAPDTTGKWFDGCDRDVILFADVKAHEIPSITQVIRLYDRYPIQVKRHNVFLTWKARVLVFTSNYSPTVWWPHEPEISYRAFERRITSIEHVV